MYYYNSEHFTFLLDEYDNSIPIIEPRRPIYAIKISLLRTKVNVIIATFYLEL
jgi:hypothetical protein